MAFALIAATSKRSVSGASVVTDPVDLTGSTLRVAVVGYYDPSGNPVISDGQSGVWNQLTEYGPTGDGAAVRIFYSVTTGLSLSGYAIANGTANYSTVCLAGFSGAHAAPFDVQNGATGDTVTSQQTGSVSPSEDNELIIAGNCLRGNAEFGTVSIDGGFTIATQLAGVAGNALSGAMAYLIQTTATAANPTWSWTNTDNSSSGIATFKASAGGVIIPVAMAQYRQRWN